MTAPPLADPDLWDRIAAHDFGDAPGAPSFVDRLARACRWRARTAAEAIAEYRRFAYLAATAPHPVTPSIAVDLVWHQHLTHSRDYWDRFCAQVLRRPLHHEPGTSDRARYERQYAQTLDSYEHAFGEVPPPRYWPPARERFAARAEPRYFVPQNHLLVPRRVIGSALTGAAGAALLWFGMAFGWMVPMLFGFLLIAIGALGLVGAVLGVLLMYAGIELPAASREIGVSFGGGDSDGGDGGGCGD